MSSESHRRALLRALAGLPLSILPSHGEQKPHGGPFQMGSPQSCRKEPDPGGWGGEDTRPCSHGRSVQSPRVTNLSFRQLCIEAQAVISGPVNSSREVPESPSCGPAVLFPRNHLALLLSPFHPSLPYWSRPCLTLLGIPSGRGQARPSHLPELNW